MMPSSVVRVTISSSTRVGFMSVVSFGVGVLVSAARAAKAKRMATVNGARIFVERVNLSMSKDGPSCSAGQY